MEELKRKLMRALRWTTASLQMIGIEVGRWCMRHWSALAVCLLLWLVVGCAHADTLEIGVLHQTFDSTRLDVDEPAGHLKIVHRSAYIWGSYENPNIRLVGQRMGDIEVIGYGLGVQRRFEDVRVFAELGLFEPSATTVQGIQDEAVVTELNNIHGWRGNRHFENTEYNIDSTVGGRIGVMWDLRRHIAVGASYRFLQLDEQLQAYTGSCDWPPTKACKSWWVDNRKLDLSAIQLGIYGRF